MFQYLGNRGYFCLFQPIIIAVDACVEGAEGNRVGEQAQKLRAARLLDKIFREKAVEMQQQEGHAQGQGQGKRHAYVEDPARSAAVAGGGFCGDKP